MAKTYIVTVPDSMTDLATRDRCAAGEVRLLASGKKGATKVDHEWFAGDELTVGEKGVTVATANGWERRGYLVEKVD